MWASLLLHCGPQLTSATEEEPVDPTSMRALEIIFPNTDDIWTLEERIA